MTCKHEESWLKHYWRPALGWQFMLVPVFDFIIFPMVAYIYSFVTKTPFVWEPMTLKESGFYYIAMAPVVGVASYSRMQEKLAKMFNTNTPEKPNA